MVLSDGLKPTDRIASGEYDASGADGIVIEDTRSGDNGVIVVNADYAISNANISLLTDADGSDTCDFSGRGSAIAVYGSESSVTIEDSALHTSGVATMPVFADDGATVTIRNSTLQSDGGTLSADYMNTPDQALMVAPPWILGIMGTSRLHDGLYRLRRVRRKRRGRHRHRGYPVRRQRHHRGECRLCHH